MKSFFEKKIFLFYFIKFSILSAFYENYKKTRQKSIVRNVLFVKASLSWRKDWFVFILEIKTAATAAGFAHFKEYSKPTRTSHTKKFPLIKS